MTEKIGAVSSRHVNIAQNQVGKKSSRHFEAGRARIRFDDVVAFSP